VDTATDAFDPAGLALPPGSTGAARRPKRPPRHKRGEKFLKGPVPWRWVQTAGRLSGKALLVGLAVWREAGCRNAQTVPLNLSRVGIPRRTAHRALRALQLAELVAVEHRKGRPPLVTLRDVPPAEAPTEAPRSSRTTGNPRATPAA
jgi:hypothetical protein